MGFRTSGQEFCVERVCLSEVDAVPVFFIAITQRGSPLLFGPLGFLLKIYVPLFVLLLRVTEFRPADPISIAVDKQIPPMWSGDYSPTNDVW